MQEEFKPRAKSLQLTADVMEKMKSETITFPLSLQ
jgi:hypothetical protein